VWQNPRLLASADERSPCYVATSAGREETVSTKKILTWAAVLLGGAYVYKHYL